MRVEDLKCKHPIWKFIGWLMLIFSSIGMLAVVYLAYMPVHIIDMDDPVQVVNEQGQPINEIKAGELLYYKISYRKYVQCPATIICQLVNKFVVSFPSFEVNMPVTVQHNITNNHPIQDKDEAIGFLKIPESASGGVHYVNISAYYRVNPLRTQNYNWVTTKFNVIPKAGAAIKEESLFVGAPLKREKLDDGR
jgi:hypothetical protein